jgi:SAM-dependent methyltransferase
MRLRASLRQLRRRHRPVRLGSLSKTTPVGGWGYDRGTPVDRWYIDRFLERHRSAITGRVLEVKDSGYTDRLGHGVTERGVLDIDTGNRRATYVCDLAAPDGALPREHFDCFVLTQTLQYVHDLPAALATAHDVLRPGGVLLATVPVVSRFIDPPLEDAWRFTPAGTARLVASAFGGELDVHAPGNVLATIAFLEGLAAEDLEPDQLAATDRRFPLLVCVRAQRSAS